MSLKEQVLQAIKAVMPAGAEIASAKPSGMESLKYNVSWMLNDDPERPNKTSKVIAICVSHEAGRDFATTSAVTQEAAYKRISAYLSEKLAQFDPQHSAQSCQATPVEQWLITSAIVLS